MNELWPVKRDLQLSDWTHREKGGRYRLVEISIPSGALADMLKKGDLVVQYESTREPYRRFSRLLSEWEAKMRRYPQAGDGLAERPSSTRRPDNCRNELQAQGKSYPRSGCAVCGNGGLAGCPYEKHGATLAGRKGS